MALPTHKLGMLTGVYESCPISGYSIAAGETLMEKMATAKMDVIVNYGAKYMTPTQATQYADLAEKHGLLVIWALPFLGTARARYETVVAAVKDRACTMGYYIADEPGQFSQTVFGSDLQPTWDAVNAWGLRIKQLDPQATIFTVTWSQSMADIATYQKPLASLPGVDRPGSDCYPISDEGTTLLGASQQGAFWRQAQMNALAQRKLSWAVGQAFDFALYGDHESRWPTLSELRLQVSNAFNAGMSLLVWYGYADIRRHNPKWWDTLASANLWMKGAAS